jgi:preprotein translocase subunit SecD
VSGAGITRRCLLAAAVALVAAGAAAEPLLLDITQASAEADARTGEPIVAFRLASGSWRKWVQFTQANVGHVIELRVDGKALSRPVIREPILQPFGQISGHFTLQEAKDLAARLSSGTKLEVEAVAN